MPSLMLVSLAVSEELKQTDRQNCALYIKQDVIIIRDQLKHMFSLFSQTIPTLETSLGVVVVHTHLVIFDKNNSLTI